jgi:hypothetical protein
VILLLSKITDNESGELSVTIKTYSSHLRATKIMTMQSFMQSQSVNNYDHSQIVSFRLISFANLSLNINGWETDKESEAGQN